MVSAFGGLKMRHAFAAETKHLPALDPGRDFERNLSIHGVDIDVRAERGLKKTDRHLGNDIRAVSLKLGMLFYADDYVQIPAATPSVTQLPLSSELEALAVVNPWRHDDFRLAAQLLDAAAETGRTVFFRYLAETLTAIANVDMLHGAEHGLLPARDLPLAVAFGTGRDLATRLGSRSFAPRTGIFAFQREGFGDAKNTFQKINGQSL